MAKSLIGVDINPTVTLMVQFCLFMLSTVMVTSFASTSEYGYSAVNERSNKIALRNGRQVWKEQDFSTCDIETDDKSTIATLTCDRFLKCLLTIYERDIRTHLTLPSLNLLSDNCSEVYTPFISYDPRNVTFDEYYVLQSEILELALDFKHKTAFNPSYFCGLQGVTNMTFTNILFDGQSLGFGERCSFSDFCVCSLKYLIIHFKSNLTVIRNSFFCGMQNLTTLILRNNAIAEIQDDAFLYLPSLERLELQNNRLATLSMELFHTLTASLKYLDVSGNKLNHEVLYSLQNLSVLEDLILDNNNISLLQDDSFKGLQALKRLSLSNNKVKELGKEFRYLTTLEELDISANAISDIIKFPFNSLVNLTVLRLCGNRFSSIMDFVSSDNYQLNVLGLSLNEFSAIPSKLNYLKNLTELDLADNNIGAISESDRHILCNITNLKSLSLANNSMHTIDADAFSCHSSLRHLDLSHNYLLSISGLKTSIVTHLYVHHNAILYLPLRFLPTNLVHLDASFNDIYAFEFLYQDLSSSGISRRLLPNLQFVNLSYNKIQTFRTEECPYIPYKPIPVIDLSYNYIPNICPFVSRISHNKTMPTINFNQEDYICKCEKIFLTNNYHVHTEDSLSPVHIYCSRYHEGIFEKCTPFSLGCPIETDMLVGTEHTTMIYKLFPCSVSDYFPCHFDYYEICGLPCPTKCNCFLSDQYNTYLIDCSNSDLTSIPYQQQVGITAVVTFSRNQVSFVDASALSPYSSAIRLDFSKNKLKSIADKSFRHFDQLEILILRYNSISEIGHYSFLGLKRLKELDLSNNRLVKIHQGSFLPLGSVQKLNLRNNMLNEISTSELGNLKSIITRQIDLVSNPWSCDCEFAVTFVSWLKDNASFVKEYEALRCLQNGSDIYLTSFNYSYCHDFKPQVILQPVIQVNVSFWIIIVNVVAVFILVTILTYIYCKKAHRVNLSF